MGAGGDGGCAAPGGPVRRHRAGDGDGCGVDVGGGGSGGGRGAGGNGGGDGSGGGDVHCCGGVGDGVGVGCDGSGDDGDDGVGVGGDGDNDDDDDGANRGNPCLPPSILPSLSCLACLFLRISELFSADAGSRTRRVRPEVPLPPLDLAILWTFPRVVPQPLPNIPLPLPG